MPRASRRSQPLAGSDVYAPGLSARLAQWADRLDDLVTTRRSGLVLAHASGALPCPAGPERSLSTDAGVTRPVSRPRSTARLGNTVEPATDRTDGDAGDAENAGPVDTDQLDTDHVDADHVDADHVDADHAEVWQLVRRAQDGDGEAFGAIYDRYVDVVFRFIYYRVNDRALAEDFTSETFLRALRRIGTISYQGRDIGAWFVTIARNIVFDHMKSARHRLETPTSDTPEGRDHERSTEAAVLDTLRSERLMQAVGQLGAEQRDCIMLRFIQGMSVAETAAIMNKNDGAIKALQHRAVRKLADLVGRELG